MCDLFLVPINMWLLTATPVYITKPALPSFILLPGLLSGVMLIVPSIVELVNGLGKFLWHLSH